MSAHAPMVLVLDDDDSVLRSVRRLLTASGFSVRTHAEPEDFFAAGLPVGPACLLLDQHLGSAKGTDVHAEILRRGWFLPTVFLTADWDVHTVVKAMRGGADNYLTKPYAPADLLKAIHEACARGVKEFAQRGAEAELRRRAESLTPRERAIILLVIQGMLNKQIAEKLQIAVPTVKLHRGRAMQKLGARNPAELARLALRIGL